MTLDEKARAYKAALDEKERLADATKENNKQVQQLEQELARMMVDEEKPDTTVDGYKFTLQEKTMYTKKSEADLAEAGLSFFDVLREQGFGELIVERVDARTLQSTMRLYAEEHDGELPEELQEVLNIYPQLGVGRRKADTKALNRARKAKEAS